MKHLRSLPAFRVDPDLREWRAPAGVLGSPAGLAATFRALRMRSVVDRTADGAVRFEAWKNPRVSGAILASLLGAAAYVALAAAGVRTLAIAAIVVLIAYYVPMVLLPSYRVSGKIEDGKVLVRLSVRGLLGRTKAFENRLRFYLER